MKRTVMVIILILIFMFTTLSALSNSSDKDYKVIKKAVKKKSSSKHGEISWFKMLVTDNFTKKVKVKITLPISIIDWLSECTKGEFNFDNKCKINLKKILKDLKKSGQFTILEVLEDDHTVKIWVE